MRIANRRLRYLAPAGVAGVVALAAGIPSLTAGASASNLPAITAQALIAKVKEANVQALQGTVQWTANLGLPDLSGLTSGNDGQVATTSGFDPTSLLSGTHDINVWSDGNNQRLSLPTGMAETDLVRVGDQAWLYDSTNQHVTHYVPAQSPSGSGPATSGPAPGPAGAPLTPDQQAANILAKLSPSTAVTAAPADEVAGQPVYQLTLAPQPGSQAAASSTLDRVTISVDANNGLPLAVAVYAAGVAAPVLSLGFTSVSFAAPAASNFAPPVGTSTTTKTVNPPAGHAEGGTPSSNGTSVSGPPWAWVLSAPSASGGGALSSPTVMQATTPVTGSFGTARLLHTSVINVLFLPNGAVLAGFVTPATLEAEAAGPVGH